MKPLDRVAFIGNSLPRRCGIATFTADLRQAVVAAKPGLQAGIVVMNDAGNRYDYPPDVIHQIDEDRIEDYTSAADALNASQTRVVCLQHEFGIFGGEAGSHILALLARLTMPVVTTLHTVLAAPSPAQREVLQGVIRASARVIVMAEKGRELLRQVYGVPADRIEIIPHGIPEVAFAEPDAAKLRLGFTGRPVILTFGLLSPSKGIEVMIDAMPLVLQRCPAAIYVVLGATHPNLVRQQGEAYRESLVARAMARGVAGSVVFLDRFVDLDMLLDFISAADVYVTPYLHEAQMTSGTLAYSYGLGKAVVSTPYWHAQDLLADGAGLLVPFNDAPAVGEAVAGLLADDARRFDMRRRAYAASRPMTWPRTALRYLSLFDRVRREHRPRLTAPPLAQPRAPRVLPEMRTEHLLAMCDDTGLLQHAVHAVADRAHGYCVDDNARALLLGCTMMAPGEQPLPEPLVARFAAFVQHAWNADRGRFRNFMSFDRRWLEASGSEDSHGRTLWALGKAARADVNASRRRWAAELFIQALPTTETFGSPRAWAFTLLGLEDYGEAVPDDTLAPRFRRLLADRLVGLMAGCATEDWTWFEDGLAYDNARMPQALILAGATLGAPGHVAEGLRALRWLVRVQTAPSGVFRPVGTDSFGETRRFPRAFDQQALEATATIAACLAARRHNADPVWAEAAETAFAWFMGHNDLAVPLADPETGACRDGLHRDRANENRGGESVLSYMLALTQMRGHRRAVGSRADLQASLTGRIADTPGGAVQPNHLSPDPPPAKRRDVHCPAQHS
jgi:glycosyltransferase involved in cell wall biosynthesis